MILPNAGESVVPGQPMSPVWRRFFEKLARSAATSTDLASLQTQADALSAQLAALDTGDKQDQSALLDQLAVLPGVGFVLRSTSGYSARDFALTDIPPDTAVTGDALVFDGTSWRPGPGGGSTVVISDTAPTSPAAGDLWADSTTGILYIYYDSAWVEFGSIGGGGAAAAADVSYDNTTSGLTATDVQAALDEIVAGGGGGGPSTTDGVTEGTTNLYFTNERVDDRVAALLVAGTGVTLTYSDVAGTLTIDAAGGGSTTVTDDFKFNTISNYTEYADSVSNWAISSTSDVLTATGGSHTILVRNGVLWADGTASCSISAANDAGLVLRAQYKDDYYLAAIHDGSSSDSLNNIKVYKRVGGSFTLLGSGSISFTRGTSHTFSFTASGTSLDAKFDGVSIVSVTDSSITASGKVGMRANATGQNTFESFTWA